MKPLRCRCHKGAMYLTLMGAAIQSKEGRSQRISNTETTIFDERKDNLMLKCFDGGGKRICCRMSKPEETGYQPTT